MNPALSSGSPGGLTDILKALDGTTSSACVSVADLVKSLGQRSFTPVILAVAVLMISPLSGVPTFPTISATIICLISAQALLGRRQLWLPEFIMRRELSGHMLHKALTWLERPSRWADRHAHRRLAALATGPARMLGFAACFLIPLGWPVLELLPFVTSIGASIIALIAFGLLTRDGVFVMAGYVSALAVAGIATWIFVTT